MNSLKLTFSITHQLFAPGKCFQISSDELGSIWSFGSFANLPRIFRGRKKALHLTTVLWDDTKKTVSWEGVPSIWHGGIISPAVRTGQQPAMHLLIANAGKRSECNHHFQIVFFLSGSLYYYTVIWLCCPTFPSSQWCKRTEATCF